MHNQQKVHKSWLGATMHEAWTVKVKESEPSTGLGYDGPARIHTGSSEDAVSEVESPTQWDLSLLS